MKLFIKKLKTTFFLGFYTIIMVLNCLPINKKLIQRIDLTFRYDTMPIQVGSVCKAYLVYDNYSTAQAVTLAMAQADTNRYTYKQIDFPVGQQGELPVYIDISNVDGNKGSPKGFLHLVFASNLTYNKSYMLRDFDASRDYQIYLDHNGWWRDGNQLTGPSILYSSLSADSTYWECDGLGVQIVNFSTPYNGGNVVTLPKYCVYGCIQDPADTVSPFTYDCATSTNTLTTCACDSITGQVLNPASCAGSGAAIQSLQYTAMPVTPLPDPVSICTTVPGYSYRMKTPGCWFNWFDGTPDCYFWCHDQGVCYSTINIPSHEECALHTPPF